MNKIGKWLVGKFASKGSNAYYEVHPEEAPEEEKQALANNLRHLHEISENHRKSFSVDFDKHKRELDKLETIEEKYIYTKDLINTLSANLNLAKLRDGYNPSKEEKRALGIYRTWLKYFEEQKEIIQAHIGVRTKAKASTKTLADFLLCEEERKPAIMEILRILFSGAKGKKAATVLIALHRLNLLILPERGKQQIYEAINKTFHLSLGNQSYQPYIIFTKKGIETKIDEIEIQEVMKKIE